MGLGDNLEACFLVIVPICSVEEPVVVMYRLCGMFNYEPEELAAALPDHMSVFCGVPATLFCQEMEDQTIITMGRRIAMAFQGRAIVNVGDILPPNGNLEQVVSLGQDLEQII